jgi:predicted HAD superfamily phosphohydrolase
LSEELINRIAELLKPQGYELVGVYDRTQLDLSKTEKCSGIQSMGGCGCDVNLDITLQEVDVSDIAIVVFADAVASVDPLENSEWCEGGIELELYIETDNLRITVDKFTRPVCVAFL